MNARAGGQALVELALLAPVMIFLAMGVWDGGAVLREQLILEEAARDGARVAATGYGPTGVPTNVICDAVSNSAKNLSGLTCAASNVTYQSTQSVTVRLTYAHALSTPVLRQLWSGGKGTITLQADATFYLPQLTPVPAIIVSSTFTPVPTSTPTPLPTSTPVPTATLTPAATATPATGSQPCSSFPDFTIPPLTTSAGFFTTITFTTPSTSYLLASWNGPSPPGLFEVHLYSGSPLGPGGSGFSSAPPPTVNEVGGSTIPFQFGGTYDYASFTPNPVPAGTYTAYFYKRSGTLTVATQGTIGCI